MSLQEVTLQAPPAVLVLWWGALALTVLVVVPLAVYLLHRAWTAARNIRRYTAEALEAGRGIAENTEAVPAVEETVAGASSLEERAGQVRDGAAVLAETLGRRLDQGRQP